MVLIKLNSFFCQDPYFRSWFARFYVLWYRCVSSGSWDWALWLPVMRYNLFQMFKKSFCCRMLWWWCQSPGAQVQGSNFVNYLRDAKLALYVFSIWINLGFVLFCKILNTSTGGLSGESKSHEIVGYARLSVTQLHDNTTQHHGRTFLCHSPMLKFTPWAPVAIVKQPKNS